MNKYINPITPIGKLRAFYCNRILPQVYDDSLSFEELLYNMFKKIDEVIDRTHTYDELFEEIRDIANNLNGHIQAIVYEQLKEWYDDGTLKALLEEITADTFTQMKAELKAYIDEQIAPALIKTPTKAPIDFTRLGRKIFRAVESNSVGESSATYNCETYSYTQGGTYFRHNGVSYFAIANVCSNYSDYRYNDNADIRIYTIGGNFVNNRHLSVAHANDMCYKDGYLYIVHDKTYDHTSTATPSRAISRISVDNIDTASVETKSVPIPAGSNVIGIDASGGEMFICDGSHNVYKYNWDTNEVTLYIQGATFLNNIKVVQNISVNKDYVFYLGYQPNLIARCNRETKEFDYVYSFGEMQNANLYKVGEPQGFEVLDDGTCYMFTSMHTYKKAFNQYDMTQFWKQNLYKNNVPAKNIPTYDYKNLVIYADNSYDNFNPDGTKDNRFKNLCEAIIFATTQSHSNKINIEIFADSTHSFGNQYLYIESNKTFNILPNSGSETQQPRIGGIQIDGGNVTIRNLAVWNSLPNNSPEVDAGSTEREIFARDCNLNSIDCSFYTGKTNGIWIQRGVCNEKNTSLGSGVSQYYDVCTANGKYYLNGSVV